MVSVPRKVDQWIMIGRDVRISPTDIDPDGVRLLAKGRMLGGPDDGAVFATKHELAVGNSLQLGPHILVTLVAVKGDEAHLAVTAPSHIEVQAKEAYDQMHGKK